MTQDLGSALAIFMNLLDCSYPLKFKSGVFYFMAGTHEILFNRYMSDVWCIFELNHSPKTDN